MIRLLGQLRCLTAEDAAAVARLRAEDIRLSPAGPGCLPFDVAPTDDPMAREVIEAILTRVDFDAPQARSGAMARPAATRNGIRDILPEETPD